MNIYGTGLSIFGGHHLPPKDNTYDLGSAARGWRNAYIGTAIYATSVVGNWSPSADDTYDLGIVGKEWKDLLVDGIAYIDDMSVPNGFSMVSEVTAFSHFDHDNGAWDFFTKTSGAAQLSRLRIPSGTDSVDIALANANLLFGSGFGIRANAANGTIVDFEAYENGAYVTVANMNSSATTANWTFNRSVIMADTLGLLTGVSADDFFAIKSYDMDGGAYTTLLQFINDNDPFFTVGVETAYKIKFDPAVAGICFGDSTDSWDFLLKFGDVNGLHLRNAADNAYASLSLDTLSYTGIKSLASVGSFDAQNTDDSSVQFKARDNGVGTVRIAQMFGGADPYFQIGRDDSGVATGAVTDMLYLQAGAGTNNESAGFGLGIPFYLGNDASELEERARLEVELVVATNGAEETKYNFDVQSGGVVARVLDITKDGIQSKAATGVIQRLAYAQIMEILGDASFFYPLVEATGTTITDFTPNGHTATPSEDVRNWDTPPVYKGSIQVYTPNGTDEEMDVADHADFSTAGAMSVGCLVKLTTSANSTVMGVWDANSKREWRLYFDASGYPTFAAWDENNAAQIGRQDQTDIGTASYHTFIATFDGGTNSSGINIYIDGLPLDDANVEVGSGFANQVDSGAALDLFFNEDGASDPENHYDGICGLKWMTKKELSSDEAWNIHQIYRGLANF